MTLEYHPGLRRDLHEARDYYARAGGEHLAERFEREFRDAVAKICAHPTAYPFFASAPGLRRVRLKRFPFVLAYRHSANLIRLLVLKHQAQHPEFGVERR